MLGDIEYTMNELFAQLGLESSDEAVEKFITENQLDEETNLKMPHFGMTLKEHLLKKEWENDAVWAVIR